MAGSLVSTGPSSPSSPDPGAAPPVLGAERAPAWAAMTLPVWRLDLAGRVVEANAALATLLARCPEELIGSPATLLGASPEIAADLDRAVAAAGRGEPAGELCGRWRRGAETLHLRLAWTLERSSHGTPCGLAVVVLDETRLVATEQVLADPAVAVSATPRRLARRRDRLGEFFAAMSARRTELTVVLDDVGQVTFVSPSVTDLLGSDHTRVLGTPGAAHVHPADLAELVGTAAEVGAGGGAVVRFRLRHRTGGWRWFEGAVTNLFDTPVGGLVLNLTDVTARARAERALAQSEARHRAIAESSSEGLWVAVVDGRTIYANDRLCQILGVGPEDLDAELLARLLAEVPVQAVGSTVAAPGAARAPAGPVRWETCYEHPDGRTRTLTVAITRLPHDDPDQEPTALAVVNDVTEARRMERELRHAALRDELTGLPNRTLLLDRLELAMTRSPAGAAAIVVDLDDFKVVTDARGHSVAAELLVAVAERLRRTTLATDTVARVDGDEFVVVSEGMDEARARLLAARILTALRAPFAVGGHTISLTASCGLALAPAASGEHLLRHAQAALHAAKEAGPGAVRLCDPELTHEVERAFELGTELWRALNHDSLSMHYQPVVDLASGRVLGVEALARWECPRLGTVPPDRFVPVAEQAGLGAELDRWALRTAMREANAMRRAGVMPREGYVAVNLSRRSVTSDWLEGYLGSCVRTSGLTPRDVVLEVTEGSVMSDPERACAVLSRLRDRGYRIALDDFGTGHSSLAVLRTLPTSVLKMDRSFVADLRDDDQALAIARMIVDLARAVGMSVVAEGVESAAHARLLTAMGCHAGQGWLWSPAVAPDEAAAGGALRRSYDRRRSTA